MWSGHAKPLPLVAKSVANSGSNNNQWRVRRAPFRHNHQATAHTCPPQTNGRPSEGEQPTLTQPHAPKAHGSASSLPPPKNRCAITPPRRPPPQRVRLRRRPGTPPSRRSRPRRLRPRRGRRHRRGRRRLLSPWRKHRWPEQPLVAALAPRPLPPPLRLLLPLTRRGWRWCWPAFSPPPSARRSTGADAAACCASVGPGRRVNKGSGRAEGELWFVPPLFNFTWP